MFDSLTEYSCNQVFGPRAPAVLNVGRFKIVLPQFPSRWFGEIARSNRLERFDRFVSPFVGKTS